MNDGKIAVRVDLKSINLLQSKTEKSTYIILLAIFFMALRLKLPLKRKVILFMALCYTFRVKSPDLPPRTDIYLKFKPTFDGGS